MTFVISLNSVARFLCCAGLLVGALDTYASRIDDHVCFAGQVPVVFRLEPPADPLPATAIPLDRFAPDARVESDLSTYRLRLDACAQIDGTMTVRRIVVGTRIDPSRAAFSESWISADDTAEGFQDALAGGGDHAGVNIIERIPVLNWEHLRIQGFVHEGRSYVVAGNPRGFGSGAAVQVGRFVVGDNLSEWFGACDAGYEEFPGVEQRVGTALIRAKICHQWRITGESSAYGLTVEVTDDHPRVRGPDGTPYHFSVTGPEARNAYRAGTGHHGCWAHFIVKTPRAEYRERDESQSADNSAKQTILYEGAAPIELIVPSDPFPGPC